MNKIYYGIAALAILAVVGIYYFFFHKACTELSGIDVSTAQLECAQSMDAQKLRARICVEIHATEECQFTEEDLPRIRTIFKSIVKSIVDKCTTDNLSSKNICTENYRGL